MKHIVVNKQAWVKRIVHFFFFSNAEKKKGSKNNETAESVEEKANTKRKDRVISRDKQEIERRASSGAWLTCWQPRQKERWSRRL